MPGFLRAIGRRPGGGEAPSKVRLLRSKVARRIVLLFVVCAVLPVAALAVVAYVQVADELRSASRRRLHTSSKSAGMEIVDRLRRLDAELALAD